jgi:hypothetical protein
LLASLSPFIHFLPLFYVFLLCLQFVFSLLYMHDIVEHFMHDYCFGSWRPYNAGFLLDFGVSEDITQGNLKYIPDKAFISVRNTSAIRTPNLLPAVSTLRYFPYTLAKKILLCNFYD